MNTENEINALSISSIADIINCSEKDINSINRTAKKIYEGISVYEGKKDDLNANQIANFKLTKISNYAIAVLYKVKISDISTVMKESNFCWDIKTRQYVLKNELEKERLKEKASKGKGVNWGKKMTTAFRVELTREAFNGLNLMLQLKNDRSVEARNKLISEAIITLAPEGFKKISKAIIIKSVNI
jgi:hypothetical protein